MGWLLFANTANKCKAFHELSCGKKSPTWELWALPYFGAWFVPQTFITIIYGFFFGVIGIITFWQGKLWANLEENSLEQSAHFVQCIVWTTGSLGAKLELGNLSCLCPCWSKNKEVTKYFRPCTQHQRRASSVHIIQKQGLGISESYTLYVFSCKCRLK